MLKALVLLVAIGCVFGNKMQTIRKYKMNLKRENMLKKIVTLILSLVFILGLFTGCDKNSGKEGQGDDGFGVKCVVESDSAYVWGAPDTVSIMRDVGIDAQCAFWGKEWLDNSDKLKCEGIKGDEEAVQVMITAKKDIKSFYLTASDLIREGGTEKIGGSNVEILAERYIQTKVSSAKPKTASEYLGWYPDALVPIDAYKARKDNKITKGDNQGIWVNVAIPEDAVAGVYNGSLTLDLDGDKNELPFSLKVFDVAMPSEVHAKTAFDIWYGEIEYGEDEEDADGNPIDWPTNYYDFIISKRLTPQTSEYMRSVYLKPENFAQFVREIIEIAKNEKITSFRMPYGGVKHETYGEVVDYDTMVGLLRAMAQKNVELKERGEDVDLFKKAYFYFNSFVDEPDSGKLGAVKYCDRAVTAAKKEVAPLLSDYPELQKSLYEIPHIITSPVDFVEGDEETGGVQTWVSQAQQYKPSILSEIAERKQSTEKYSIGEGFWIYMTMETNNPYPSLQLDDNLLSSRTIFWMSKYYDLSCVLYWCACYYSKYTPTVIKRDIWNDPTTYLNANGDGYLVYPGTYYGLTSPISTLRLESLRQGTEDYEYIYMLEKAIADYNGSHGTDYDFSDIMLSFYNDVFVVGDVRSKTNVENFMTARSKLLTLLESVINDKDDADALLSYYASNKA